MSINSKQNLIGSLSSKIKIAGKLAIGNFTEDNTQTFLLVDEAGNEIPAVFVDEEVEITATPNDIRLGTTAITSDGVVVGEKEIPAYHTSAGYKIIPKGSSVVIYHDRYDYTGLQAVLCKFNRTLVNSVATIRVAIEDNVYNVNSEESIAMIIRNDEKKCVDFGIVNDSDGICILRYFMYKEIK